MADIAELIVALKLQDGVSSGLGRLNGQLRGMDAGLSQVGRGIGQVGRGLDTIATRGAIAAAAGLTAVVSAAVSFEDAFAGVRKTVDATEDQFGVLEERLREMARTMPVSFEELAGIAEAGGALGIAFEGLDEFTKVVADLAATTDLSADQAATSLGVLGNVLQLRAEDFDNFGSALVDLGNKGASTETQILAIAERIGATGQLIGLTSDQVLGFGAAVANVGIEAEAGGSALQRFFIDALTAVESGGEDLETFARTAGQSAEAFQTAFRDDAGAALADFIEGLGQLPEAVQIQTLQDLGFNDVRITRTLLGLAGDVENLQDSLTIASEAFAANSALGEEAAKRYATTASQLKILKQNVVDAAVTIGDELLPVVSELTSEFVAFINKPEIREGIKDFAVDLAEGIRGFAGEIRKADFGPLLDTLKGAAAIAKGAFDAFRSLPAPIQQLAIAALVANKVTGGAVGQIAGGLANITGGLIKIAFERGASPANPLWVQSVAGPLGGPGGAGGRGGPFGWLTTALAAAARVAPVAGAVTAPLILSGSQNVTAEMSNKQIQLTKQIEQGAITSAEAARLWMEAYGQVVNNPFRVEMPDLTLLGESFARNVGYQVRDIALSTKLLPGFSEARNVGDSLRTTIQPLVGAIGRLQTAVEGSRGFGLGALQEVISRAQERARVGGGNFVETVRLDPSQVTDLREPTRIAAEQLRLMRAEAFSADVANRTANAFQTAELARNRQATVERLTTLAGKYDAQNAQISNANRQLASLNAKTPPTHPVTFHATIPVSVGISATLIEQRLVTARLASVGIPTAPRIL